jgi:hypothetical protein
MINNSKRLKLLTVQEAERSMRDGDSMLYVMNSSNPRGNINMTIDGANGTRQTITIPITDIPVDLSIQAVKRFILESPEFRRTFARGFLKIVSSEDAENLFANDDKARQRQAKLYNTIDMAASTDLEIVQASGDSSVINKIPATQLDPFIVNLVIRSNQGEEEADALIQELGARADLLSLNDLQYVVANSQNSELKEQAAEYIQLKQ